MVGLIERIEQNLRGEKLFAVATIVAVPTGGKPGGKLLVYPDGTTEGNWPVPQVRQRVIEAAQELMEQETSETRMVGEYEVFVEVFAPPPRLIVIGAVHIALPLTRMAKLLGYRVLIVDGRARFATRERFAEADELIVEWPDEAIPRLGVDASTYVVILTHDPKFDLPALAALAKLAPRYIGAMGSRETRRQHFGMLRGQGVPDAFLQTVYGPVGLDIGARSPEEVALSILAEMTAVRYHKAGGHLAQAAPAHIGGTEGEPAAGGESGRREGENAPVKA